MGFPWFSMLVTDVLPWIQRNEFCFSGYGVGTNVDFEWELARLGARETIPQNQPNISGS